MAGEMDCFCRWHRSYHLQLPSEFAACNRPQQHDQVNILRPLFRCLVQVSSLWAPGKEYEQGDFEQRQPVHLILLLF